jgi:hypothetical protein
MWRTISIYFTYVGCSQSQLKYLLSIIYTNKTTMKWSPSYWGNGHGISRLNAKPVVSSLEPETSLCMSTFLALAHAPGHFPGLGVEVEVTLKIKTPGSRPNPDVD